jgi:two-component system NtrC family response regulator
MAQVLIIDDDKTICSMLGNLVKHLGHQVTYSFTIAEGLAKVAAKPYQVVFLDVQLPDGNGLEILPALKAAPSFPEVIIMTGFGDPDGAEVAIKSGAWDYLQKPLSPKQILLSLNRVFQYRENRAKAIRPAVSLKLEGFVGSSPRMRVCLDLVAQAANCDLNVLLTGETGTGKELIARAIHNNSPRSQCNLVVVDCAALPETLIGSVLFGHEKGAFTGAEKAREGLIQQAGGGTLFLDEIGELPLSLQRNFLRVLEERRFRPLGARQERKSDFRLIAATNRYLEQMVESGQFREDLFFRVRAIVITLPPLRERGEDLKDLVFFYLAKICEKHGVGAKGISPEFIEALRAYSWPGNVRELVNTLDSAISAAFYEPTLFPKHLPLHFRVLQARAAVRPVPQAAVPETADATGSESPHYDSLSETAGLATYRHFRESALGEIEKEYLQKLMRLARGKVNEACHISGLSRSHLYVLLKKHQISRLGWPSSY